VVLFFLLLFLWYSVIFFEIPPLTTEGRARLISQYGLLELLLLGILLLTNLVLIVGRIIKRIR